MNPTGFQRQPGEIAANLLHGLAETLAAAWHRESGRVLGTMWPLLAHHSIWFPEELRELERVKRCLAWCWRKRKKELDQTGVKATIKIYFVVLRAAKRQYHVAFVASADWHPAGLFRVARTLLGKGDPDLYLRGYAEEFSRHLEDKIAQIRSQLNTKHDASPVEMPGDTSPFIWEGFDSVGAEEMDGVLWNANAATAHSIHVVPGCLRRLGWVQVTVNSSLLEGVFPAPLKGCCSLLKRPLLAPPFWTTFVQCLTFPF